jgi:hypothetical protein
VNRGIASLKANRIDYLAATQATPDQSENVEIAKSELRNCLLETLGPINPQGQLEKIPTMN